jgi:peptidoglycan/LPS O-acetylase OafA/YrhL
MSMFSFVYAGAAGFVLMVALYFMSASWRGWFRGVFRLPKPKNQAEIGAFDSLRGLLAMWVALYHAFQWLKPANDPGRNILLHYGPYAVNAFVMLSGFLIYRSVSRMKSPGDLGGYLQRRFFRIYPLYLFSILVIFLGAWLSGGNASGTAFWENALMLRLFGWKTYANPPAWSLYVEEGFYLLIPLWILFFRRNIPGFSLLFYFLFSVFSIFSREMALLPYFCLGILVSQLLKDEDELGHSRGPAVLGGGVAYGTFAAAAAMASRLSVNPFFVEVWYPFFFSQAYAACWLVIVYAAVRNRTLNLALGLYPLRVVGIISYSIYLLHSLIVTIGTPILFDGVGGISGSLPLTAAVHGPAAFYFLYATAIIFYSCVTYAAVEYPFLRLRNADLKTKIRNLVLRLP